MNFGQILKNASPAMMAMSGHSSPMLSAASPLLSMLLAKHGGGGGAPADPTMGNSQAIANAGLPDGQGAAGIPGAPASPAAHQRGLLDILRGMGG